MHKNDHKILKYNHGEKSLKAPAIIYACLLEKMHSCQNNPEKSYTEKKKKRFAFWLLVVYKLLFDATKNKIDL